MFTTITAKRSGTCKRCGQAFAAGTRIRFGGRSNTYHLSADCPAGTARGGKTEIEAGTAPDLDRMIEDQNADITREY